MPVSKKIYLMLPSLLDNHPRIGEKIIWIVNLQSANMSELQKYDTYWEWRTKLGNDRMDRNEQRRQPGQQDWLQPSSQISGATHHPDGLYNVVTILILRGVLLIKIYMRWKQPSFQWDASGMEGSLFVAKVIIMKTSDHNLIIWVVTSMAVFVLIFTFDYMPVRTMEKPNEKTKADACTMYSDRSLVLWGQDNAQFRF